MAKENAAVIDTLGNFSSRIFGNESQLDASRCEKILIHKDSFFLSFSNNYKTKNVNSQIDCHFY